MNGKQYLEHMAGIANLLEWIIVNEKAGYEFQYEEDRIIFNETITQRFLVGTPKQRAVGSWPFLAAQKREAVFLRLLNITRAIVREGDNHLHLVISGVKGDGESYPDLPPFILSLAFDYLEKAGIISKAKSIDCRGFWIDDDDSVVIGTKAIFWNKPLLVLPATAPLLDKIDQTDGPTFSDIIKMKIEATNVSQDPGFVRG